jgi:hypothetical protein
MTIADKPLAELVSQLPPELQSSVRDFVEFLIEKRRRASQQSALDVLASSAGHRSFQSAQDVADYLSQERSSWER